MNFIKRSLTTLALVKQGGLLVLIGLVSACSSMPTPEKKMASAVQSESATQQNVTGAEPPASAKQQLLAQNNLFRQQQPAISQRAQQRLKAALQLKQAQDFSAAIAALTRITEEFPSLSMTWLHLGDIAYEQAQFELAIGHYQQAIAVNQYNYFAHNRLAHLLRHKGQFATALQHYQLAINAWPGFALAYLNRGILQDLYRGDKAAALADYHTYQLLTDGSDNHIKGWIADLGRQIDVQSQGVTP